VSKLDSALEPGFGLLVAKIGFLLQTAPFSLSIPSFGTPHVLADVCAASRGDAGCAHRFSAVADGALSFFLFVCHIWPERIQESSTGFSNPER
jgi:hypothetical protein